MKTCKVVSRCNFPKPIVEFPFWALEIIVNTVETSVFKIMEQCVKGNPIQEIVNQSNSAYNGNLVSLHTPSILATIQW